MLRDLWKKWQDRCDEKRLAEHQARDSQLGSPTKATLDERAERAARKGYWKTAIAALDQGASVDAAVNESWKADSYSSAKKLSLAHIAIEQDNAEALAQLLQRGAKPDFIGIINTSGGSWTREDKYAPVEYAALQGAKNCLPVLLEHGGNPPEALNGALRIAAGEKTYLGMTEALLKAGANDFDGAQRAAEVRRNDPAILLIKGAAKQAFDAARDRKDTPATAAPAPGRTSSLTL